MRRLFGWIMVAMAVLGFRTTPVDAQLSPSDSAAVLLRTAQEFEREGETEVAGALYTFILERFASTPAAEAARDWLLGGGDRLDPVSRLELPVFGTLYGLWLGVAVPAAFGADDSEAYGAGLLIGGPLGLFSARAAQRSRQYSEGQARAISWGGVFGTWQGFGWAELVDLGASDECYDGFCYESDADGEAILGAMVVGGLAGITTGALIARNPVRSGVSSAAQGGSIWGTLYGAAIAGMFDPDDGDAVLLSSLVGGNLGLVGGALAGRRYGLTRPRVRWINLGALVGALGGLGIDLLVQPDDEVVALGIPLATSIGGLVIAANATRDMVPGLVDRGEPDMDGALLGYSSGRWHVAPPVPVPAMLPRDDANGRTEWRPGLTVELFRAKF
jgi:hypothetical protein